MINGRQITRTETYLHEFFPPKLVSPAHTHHMPYNPCLPVTVAFKANCISLALQCGKNACSLYLQALQHASAQLKATLQLDRSRPQRSVTASSSARDTARGCRGSLECSQVHPCACLFTSCFNTPVAATRSMTQRLTSIQYVNYRKLTPCLKFTAVDL